MSDHDRSDIREMKTYVDSEGRKIYAFEQVYGKSKDEPMFRGVAKIQMNGETPDGRPLPPKSITFEFPIEGATTPRKAFELFDKVAKSAFTAWEKQQQEQQVAAASRIVGARMMPRMSGLLGPDGKPVGGVVRG